MGIVINSVIGGLSGLVSTVDYFNCAITGVRLQPAVRLHRWIITVQND